jgi:hypothetical protein
MMTIPFPVPSEMAWWTSAWDDTGTVACTTACAPSVSTPAERSCLDSRLSKQGRYRRLIEWRGMMDLLLGFCPDEARTFDLLRKVYGWCEPGLGRQPPEWSGTPVRCDWTRRIQSLNGDGGVWSPPFAWVGRRIKWRDLRLSVEHSVARLTQGRFGSLDLACRASVSS